MVVVVPTGTISAAMEHLDSNTSATHLRVNTVQVERLPKKSAALLTLKYANIKGDPSPFVEDLIDSGGRIPLLQIYLGLGIAVHTREIKSREDAVDVFNDVVGTTGRQYSEQLWLDHFGTLSVIKKLIYYSVWKIRVTKETKLNGATIGRHEFSGLIFLQKVNDKVQS